MIILKMKKCFVIFYLIFIYLFIVILYYDQQMHNYSTIYHTPPSFRRYHVILRQLVINTLPSYTSVSNATVGNTIYN